MTLHEALANVAQGKPLVLDGGFGTMVQTFNLVEQDFRGYRYRNLPGMLLGNNEKIGRAHV